MKGGGKWGLKIYKINPSVKSPNSRAVRNLFKKLAVSLPLRSSEEKLELWGQNLTRNPYDLYPASRGFRNFGDRISTFFKIKGLGLDGSPWGSWLTISEHCVFWRVDWKKSHIKWHIVPGIMRGTLKIGIYL